MMKRNLYHIIGVANAQQIVAAAKNAVACCDELSQNILTRLYLTTYPPTGTSLAFEIGYGYTQFNQRKKEALLQFAEAFMSGELLGLK
ncbi:hypothetical protein [Loigolactobacillus binensis]|uniref:ArpU family transcriptional regulator n=1 Tax=Loigolactobacillus binensis TaxID=2559922 RepID=A0ABW3EFQ6_9LACO|nr:hypothetical protein [Loigolactobacillus binensis]